MLLSNLSNQGIKIFDKYLKSIKDYSPIKYIGQVNQVIGLMIESIGPQVDLGELCIIETLNNQILAEVVGFKEDKIILMPYSNNLEGIHSGSRVIGSGSPLQVSVSKDLLGRVINGIGQPIDGKGEIFSSIKYSPYNSPPQSLKRKRINIPISTGIKVIDGLLTIGEGQRMGIFAATGMGKSSLLGMIARYGNADVNVVVLVGERSREVLDFIEKDLGHEGLRRTVLIVSTSDNSALMRIKAAFVGTTIAEYFRDQGKNVCLMMDSITRFARAQRELGLTIGEPPTAKAYPPSVYSLIPRLLERAGKTDKGCITAFYTVLVEGDDINEPISDNVKGALDGHIVLSKHLANQKYYPSVDITESISRLSIDLLSNESMDLVHKIVSIVSSYSEAEDLIMVGAYVKGSNSKIDYAIKMIDQVRKLFNQRIDEYFSLENTFEEIFKLFSKSFDLKKEFPKFYEKFYSSSLRK